MVDPITNRLKIEEYDAIKAQKFEVQCLQMKLEQVASGGQIYTGAGKIYQGQDGQIHFILYAKEPTSFEDLLGFRSAQAGQIIPETEFYDLTASDISGRQWFAKRIHPSKYSTEDGTLCSGDIFEIESISEPFPIKAESLEMRIFDEIEVPFNNHLTITKNIAGKESSSSSTNVLKFETEEYSFTLHKDTSELSLSVHARKQALPENFDVRVTESLQFVTAHPIDWTIAETNTEKARTIRIRSTKKIVSRSNNHPPFAFDSFDSESFINMFNAYLGFVLRTISTEKLHPISAQMRAISYASAGSVEARALTLSISIPSILKYADHSEYKLSTEDEIYLRNANEYFDSWEGSKRLTMRIKGLLSTLKQQSETMILENLIARNVIRKDQKVSWQSLRHKLAHGENPLNSVTIQDFLDLTNSVRVMFYHLVFYIIGYTGKYTDYSVTGWPTKEYTTRSSESAEVAKPD